MIEYNNSKWGHYGGLGGKDPARKHVPRTMTKKRVNSNPKPYMKIMSKKRNRG